MSRAASLKTVVSRLFDDRPFPIYLLDEQRQIVYGNPSLSEWTGVPLEQLIGQKCEYYSGETSPGGPVVSSPALPVERLAPLVANALCPPPLCFCGQDAAGWLTLASEAAPARRQARFLPLGDGSEAFAVLALVGDSNLGAADAGGVNQSTSGQLPPATTDARQLHEQIQLLRREQRLSFPLKRLVGRSSTMVRVRQQVEIAGQTRCRVLITGPPGSGHESVARVVHQRRDAKGMSHLVPLACAVLDAELLQTTIEAFLQRLSDLSEEVPGTLLLLDVDRLEPDAQVALLGFLAIRELELPTIATSQRNFAELAASGTFRRDLANELSTLEIELPALASRREDLPLLLQYFVEQSNRGRARQLAGFSPEALDELMAYEWPGDLDQLEELVAAACRVAQDVVVQRDDLPEIIRLAADAASHPAAEIEAIHLPDYLAQVERELIARALRQAKGNKTKAARQLGIHRARLLRRIAELKLE